jgi:hypothetical protein
MKKYAPFMQVVHSIAHWTNIVVHILSKLLFVSKIEVLFQLVYTFYSTSFEK